MSARSIMEAVKQSDKQGPRNIALLGSTGSIGTQTLEIARLFPGKINIAALAAHRNISLLAVQAEEFKPQTVVVGDESLYLELKSKLSHLPIEVLAGQEGLKAAASMPVVETVVAAVVGFAGLASVGTASPPIVLLRWPGIHVLGMTSHGNPPCIPARAGKGVGLRTQRATTTGFLCLIDSAQGWRRRYRSIAGRWRGHGFPVGAGCPADNERCQSAPVLGERRLRVCQVAAMRRVQ